MNKRVNMKTKQNKKTLAITQIFLLVVGTIAISWMIGSSIGVVSATTFTEWPPAEGTEIGTADNPVYNSYGTPVVYKYVGNGEWEVSYKSSEYTKFDKSESSSDTIKDALGKYGNTGYSFPYEEEEEQVGGYGDYGYYDGEGKYYPVDVKSADKNNDGQITGDETGKAEQLVDIAIKGFLGGGTGTAGTIVAKKLLGGKEVPLTKEALEKLGISKEKIAEILKKGGKEAENKLNFWQWVGKAKPEGGWGSFGEWGAHALKGAAVSAASSLLVIGVFKLAGANEKNMRTVKTSAWIAGAGSTAIIAAVGMSAWWGGPITIGLAMIGILATYQILSQEIFHYSVGVWQPQSVGEHCEECNALEYGCSEYQCHSYGTACDIINEGQESEMCAWVNPKDAKFPILTARNDVLLENYEYVNNNEVLPPDRGVKIKYTGTDVTQSGCIPSFTSLILGVKTDELSHCKIDTRRLESFDEMLDDMEEGSAFTYNHTLTLPHAVTASSEQLEEFGIAIENEREYSFYIRCEDTNQNPTPMNFVMSFCVDSGPDRRIPIIEGTNYKNGAYLPVNSSSPYLEVYTNEPAECKWDFQDVDYSMMNNDMSDCSTDLLDYLNTGSYYYGCKGELNSVKDMATNKFYIRCKDKAGNSNKLSYELELQGTEELIITSVEPNNEKIVGAVESVPVRFNVATSGGAELGKAKCEYQKPGQDFWTKFYNNGNFDYSSENTEKIYLTEGEYSYNIKCSDAAGNTDTKTVNFTVETDNSPPMVVRAYYEDNYLKIITDEETASDMGCVYSNEKTGCDYPYDDGLEMTKVGDNKHYVEWESGKTYYIKCKDKFENRLTSQNQCNIIVKPYEDYKKSVY